MNEMKIVNLKTISNSELDKMIKAFWFPPYNGAGFYINNQYYTLVNQELLIEISKIIKNFEME